MSKYKSFNPQFFLNKDMSKEEVELCINKVAKAYPEYDEEGTIWLVMFGMATNKPLSYIFDLIATESENNIHEEGVNGVLHMFGTEQELKEYCEKRYNDILIIPFVYGLQKRDEELTNEERINRIVAYQIDNAFISLQYKGKTYHLVEDVYHCDDRDILHEILA